MRFSIFLRIGFSYAYTVRPNYSFRRISPRRRQTESVQVPLLCNKDNNQKDVCKEQQTETPQHPRINLFSFSLIFFFSFLG